MSDQPAPIDPSAIPTADLAKMLSRASGRTVAVEAIAADVAAGAPANADGTINLVHYAAWLAKEAPS